MADIATRIALFFFPGPKDAGTLELELETGTEADVEMKQMSTKDGSAITTGFKGTGTWKAQLHEPGLYGFTTTTTCSISNPAPTILQLQVASGKDPWPPPPPPPPSMGIAKDQYEKWAANFLLAIGGQVIVGPGETPIGQQIQAGLKLTISTYQVSPPVAGK